MIKRKTLKKSIALLMAIFVLLGSFSMFPMSAFAKDLVGSITSEQNFTANVGEIISIPIKMNNNKGIMSWTLYFDYDEEALEPISIASGEANGCLNMSGLLQNNIDSPKKKPGELKVSWAAGGLDNEYYEGTMFYINMKVKDDFMGNEINIGKDKGIINIRYDVNDTLRFDEEIYDYEEVALSCGAIIYTYEFGKTFYQVDMMYAEWDENSYTETDDNKGTVLAGDKFAVYQKLNGGASAGVCKMQMSYDSNNFEFLGYLKSNLELDTTVKVKNEGIVEWFVDFTDVNNPAIVDLTNNIVLTDADRTCCLAFKAKSQAYRGEYDFSCTTSDISGVDDVRFRGIKVNVGKSSESEIMNVFSDEAITGAYGEIVNVPVYIENNHGLMGYRLKLDYDRSLLKYIGATVGQSFGSIVGNIFSSSINTRDELIVQWFGTENCVSDGLLFTIQFEVLTNEPVDATIDFSYLDREVFNEAYEDVTLNCEPVQLLLNKPAPVLSDFIIKTVSLSLESSITMNFKVPKSVLDEYENYSVRFSCADLEDEVVTEYKEQGDYYVFSYKGVSPQMMNDDVTATLTATFKDNGRAYTTPEKKVSVKYYAYTLLERYADNTKMCVLLVDLLNYGAAAQQYRNYQWNVPVNADLTDAQKALGTTGDIAFENIRDYNYQVIDNPTTQWTAAGLVLNNAVTVRAKFTADSIEGKTVKVSCNGRTYTYSSDELVDNKDGTFYVYCEGINAHEMSRELLFAVYDNGVQCSNTMRYSVESYASTVQSSAYAGTQLDNLTQHMMRYGKSAEAYIN